MFDVGVGEVLALAVVALLVFGPERLPRYAADAGRFVRQLRDLAAGARRDLAESLGPEFRDVDLTELNPRGFVKRHLWDEIDRDDDGDDAGGADRGARQGRHHRPVPGEAPPFDDEAT